MAKEKKQKKKKSILWKILLPIIILILIVAILLGVAFYFIYDKTDGESYANENRTLDDEANRIVLSSFDNTKDKGTIDISMDKQTLDQLLYLALNNLPNNVKSSISKTYVEINNDNYKFYLQLKAYGIKTRICIDTTFSNDSTNKKIVFKINNLSIGKINGLDGIALSLAKKYIKEEQIASTLASNGLHMTVSLDNKQITYTYASIQQDIVSFLPSSDSITSNISPFINFMFDNDLVSFNNNDNKLSFTFDINQFNSNSTYMEDSTPYYDIGTIPTQVNGLVDSNIITTTQAPVVFDYLINGYDGISEENQTIIDSLDLSSLDSIGNDKTTYEGIVPQVSSYDPSTSLSQNITTSHEGNTTILTTSIKESDLNNLFHSQDVIGTNMYYNKTIDEKEKSIYVALDDIKTNIVDNSLYLIARLNLNGFITSLIYDTELDQSSIKNYSFDFKIKNMYLGSLKASDEITSLFNSYVQKALENNDWLKLDNVKNTLTFSLNTAINSIPAISSISQLANIDFTPVVKGESLSDNGTIDLQFSYSLI